MVCLVPTSMLNDAQSVDKHSVKSWWFTDFESEKLPIWVYVFGGKDREALCGFMHSPIL